jgi:membrane associated rhomboid family serine protease
MFIPIGHENLRGRRWPWVTIAIIALNFVVFLGTKGALQEEAEKLGRVKLQILVLASSHPDVHMPADVQDFVQDFQRKHAAIYQRLGRAVQYRPIEGLDESSTDPVVVDALMAGLAQQFEDLQTKSVLGRYGFIPAKPSGASYVTSAFLHGGWLHVIFNMWFLWLAGSVLEDAWGRVIFPTVYVFAGVVALIAQGAISPHSTLPVIGASGAIAGLIGAFLVRFPMVKIRLALMYWLVFVRPTFFTFYARAYVILPIWLVVQVLWGFLSGPESGTAYWVHVGGFIFGAIAAVILKATGLEHAADKAIEAKVSWEADPRLVKAGDLISENQADAAIAEIQGYLREKPNSLEGYEFLLRAQEKKQDMESQKGTLATLCRLYFQAGEGELAWKSYEHFQNLGGETLPVPVWLQLCRHLESEQAWERTVAEYEKLAETYPADRSSVAALVGAARVQAKKLNNRSEAERLYRLANASPVSHLDWEAAIQAGLKELGAEPKSVVAAHR